MALVKGTDSVGPNAIVQSVAALHALCGWQTTQHIVESAGLRDVLDRPPHDMVPASEAARLHSEIARQLPRDLADEVARDAGRRTAAYILAHRIPRTAQWGLRALPARLSGLLLLKAVCQHSWTFAGHAPVSCQRGDPIQLVIQDNPIAVPGCPWHRSVFETLFRQLAGPLFSVEQSTCCALGDDACRFTFHRQGRSNKRQAMPRHFSA